jgi:hypothetical protein
MPDQLSALVPKKKRNRAFLIPEKGVGTVLHRTFRSEDGQTILIFKN